MTPIQELNYLRRRPWSDSVRTGQIPQNLNKNNRMNERKARQRKNKTDREFISLEVHQVGFVVYGLGAGARDAVYRGAPLVPFLDELWKRFGREKNELNALYLKLDKENQHARSNQRIIQRFLLTAQWAYALAVDLNPFQKQCFDGPTNPLRFFYIQRLEEIFTRCFAAAHCYGAPDESMAGLRGLLTDFEVNGGIDGKTGEEGDGFYLSFLMYYRGYFVPAERRPVAYERFGELLDAVATLVQEHYPKVVPRFRRHLTELLTEENHGFASTAIRSQAKTTLIQKITELEFILAAEKKKVA